MGKTNKLILSLHQKTTHDNLKKCKEVNIGHTEQTFIPGASCILEVQYRQIKLAWTEALNP